MIIEMRSKNKYDIATNCFLAGAIVMARTIKHQSIEAAEQILVTAKILYQLSLDIVDKEETKGIDDYISDHDLHHLLYLLDKED